MSTAAHHLERSRRYLRLSRANAAGAEHHRAADALRRSVTHAATAVMAAEGPAHPNPPPPLPLPQPLGLQRLHPPCPPANLPARPRPPGQSPFCCPGRRPPPAPYRSRSRRPTAQIRRRRPSLHPLHGRNPGLCRLPAPQPARRSPYHLRDPRRHPGPLQRAPSGLQRPPRRPDPLRPRPLPQLRCSAHPREHSAPHPQPTSPRPRTLHGLVHRPVAWASPPASRTPSRYAIINL